MRRSAHSNFLLFLRKFLLRLPTRVRPGATAVARWLASVMSLSIVIKSLHSGLTRRSLLFCCDLADPLGSHLFWSGDYPSDPYWVLPRVLPENGVFIDVGAGQGEFTLLAARLMPTGVVALEPYPDVLVKLDRNVGLNRMRSSKHKMAVVSIAPLAAGVADIGVALVADEPSSPAPTRRWGTGNRGTPKVDIASIASSRTLDTVVAKRSFSHLDLIRVNAGGHAEQVLRGGVSVLSRLKPQVLVNLNEAALKRCGSGALAVFEFMALQGYTGFAIRGDSAFPWAGKPIQGYVLFVPDALAASLTAVALQGRS